MPTPFYHLHIGETILRHNDLPPAAASRLRGHRAAFLFGCTAPDVQSVSQQHRAETHFFDLPILETTQLPWEAFWERTPTLHPLRALPPAQQAFLAGYICHLQADWLWMLEIFLPNFVQTRDWAPQKERMVLHNVLRSYLDAQMRTLLPAEMGAEIATAEPHGWLPFVQDAHLSAWRDILAGQFQQGAEWLTVKIFSDRQGVPQDVYYDLLASEDRMQEYVFSHVSLERVKAFDALLLASNLHLLKYFYEGDYPPD